MKKIIYFTIACLMLLNSACRLDKLDIDCLEQVTFEQTYSNAEYFVPEDMKETSDGRYIICGTVHYGTDQDIFLMKVDRAGEVVFFESERKAGTDEICNSIVVTESKGFLICGEKESKPYFANYNFEGKLLADNRVELFDIGACRCITPDGVNYAFSGRAGNPSINNAYVGKLNLQGQVPTILTHYLPNPRSGAEDVLAVISSKGGYTAVGHSYNKPGSDLRTAMHFFRLDENLQRIPNSEIFHHLGTQQDIAHEIVETTDGNYMIVGDLHGTAGGENAFLLEVDPFGEIINLVEYGGNLKDRGRSIIHAHEANQYIIAGFSRSLNTDGSEDLYLAKIKRDGTPIWERTFGRTGFNESAHTVLRAECGGYIAMGLAEKNDGTVGVYMVKIDADGHVN